MPRASEFTQEIADLICERIADGESLRSICKDEALPSTVTVFKWLNAFPDFASQYTRAREAQADALVDEILEIVDDGRNDWMERRDEEDGNAGWRENGEAMRRSALRVDARKWMAGKLQPKKYSEKHQLALTGADGGAVRIEAIRRVIVDPTGNPDSESVPPAT
jgi:hypothetical protein